MYADYFVSVGSTRFGQKRPRWNTLQVLNLVISFNKWLGTEYSDA